MSASEILKKIHSDAQAEVAQIEGQAAADVAVLEEKAAAQRMELQAVFEAKRDRMTTRDREEIVSKAQQLSQMELQRDKRAAVDEVMSYVLTQLSNEGDDTYRDRYLAVLQSLPLAGVTVETVETAPERVSVTIDLLAQASITATVKPDESISGGMRIITDTQQFDCTLDRFFATVRPQLEIEVARIFFGK